MDARRTGPLADSYIDRLVARANRLLAERRVREALDLHERAVALGLDPLANGGERWLAAMLLGDVARAWAVGDHVLRRAGRLRPPRPALPPAHGVGWCAAGGAAGAGAVLPLSDAVAPPHDAAIELMELPHAFRTTLDTLPAAVPYVAVDAARVAAAPGAPVWTLLRFAADWRWMVGRDDSSWYPAMRLFRQAADGDWRAPVEAVARTLEGRVSPRRSAAPPSR